jgi:hypothetical protein
VQTKAKSVYLSLGGQCRRSNIVCQGYSSDLTFVRYSPTRVGPSHFSAAAHEDQLPAIVNRTTPPVTPLDQSLMNSAVDSYIFDNYWHEFFPKAKADEKKWIPSGSQISAWIPAGWIFEMRDHCAADAMIRTGMQANAYSMFGKKSDDKRLSVASMQAYSMVLHEVHRCLQDPDRRTNDSVLAACKLLALYEVGVKPEERCQRRHC